ncbi:MAG: S8 family serine peptidase [Pseudomonadota bacterium]
MFQFAQLRLGALVFGVGLALLGCGIQQGADPADVVGARKIVALVPDQQSARLVEAEALSKGYRPLGETRLSGLGLTMLTYQMPEGVTGPQAIAALEGAAPGSTVGVNHAYRLQQQPLPDRTLDYADTMMRWANGGCRAQVSVGVIDTTIDTASHALRSVNVTNRQFFDGPSPKADHGTDVASILADPDRLRGVRIYGASVFGRTGNADLVAGADALVRALDWLAEEDVRLVNLALAGPYNKLLNLAVERAAERGLILIAAVGNEGPNAEPLYPAGFADVIAVTAVDANGRIYRKAVRGGHVDVAAPGVDVLVRNADRPRFVTGTSIATPLVTARLAADAYFKQPRTVAETRNRLAATTAELGPAGRDDVFGHGLALADGICSNG